MNVEQNTSKQLEWPNYGAVTVWTKQPLDMKPEKLRVQQERERSFKRSSALWTALCTAISVSMMSGCASSQTISVSTELPASLRESCPQLPVPTQGDGAYVFLYLRDVIALYNDCASKHDATVEAIK